MTITPALDYRRVADIDDLPAAFGQGSATELLAGGTDLAPLRFAGLVSPATLVDVKQSDLPRGIERIDDGWRIGALTTLAQLADDEQMASAFPAIGEAIRQAATTQIRNRATVGGNLLQRARCPYFRDADIDCWLKGGDDCPAKSGRNEHHALVDTAPCVAVQPSDLASVLVALDAVVHLSTPGHDDVGLIVPVADFLQPPTAERRSLHALPSGTVITSIGIPKERAAWSTYLKAMDRTTWQFALVGIAAVLDIDASGNVVDAHLVASAVANIPLRLERAEQALIGSDLDADSIRLAADSSGADLVALSENAYKIPLLRGLVIRAMEQAAHATRS